MEFYDIIRTNTKEHAAAFTHGGKFHADDVFSAALLLHFNPQLTIQRGNRVPEDFAGIVFDIEEENTTITKKTAGSGKPGSVRGVWPFMGGTWHRNFKSGDGRAV